jgi:hypothetical protein
MVKLKCGKDMKKGDEKERDDVRSEKDKVENEM